MFLVGIYAVLDRFNGNREVEYDIHAVLRSENLYIQGLDAMAPVTMYNAIQYSTL